MSLAAYQDVIADLVRDRDGLISPAQRDIALQTAVLRYSEHRPLELVEDVTSAGGRRLTLPENWQSGRSRTLSLELPPGEVPPAYIEHGTWTLYQGPSTAELHLPLTLSAGEVVRVTYTRNHTLDAEADTIPSHDARAVACLAASDLCGQMARYYGQESESSISADAVDRKSKADTYRMFERDLRSAYFSHLGIADRESRPAGTTVAPMRPKERERLFGRRR
jgi:hypothetical protein